MIRYAGWFWFADGQETKLTAEKCGKWMYFFTDQQHAIDICEKAIKESVCHECKCTDMLVHGADTGVICFYLNGNDTDNHRRVLEFMFRNDLIPRTQAGKLKNIGFKFDSQTLAGEYGDKFTPKIVLSDFLDLETGAWCA